MDEKMLSLEQEIKIKEKALKLKEEKKLRKICPMVVFGDTANGEKEIYVAYMSEPSFPQFSKFMAASKKWVLEYIFPCFLNFTGPTRSGFLRL